MYSQDKDLEEVRRKLNLIESSPSASGESWREESLGDEREVRAGCERTETDIKDQP